MATYYFSDVAGKSGDGSFPSPFAPEDAKEAIRKIVESSKVIIIKRLD